MDKQILNFTVNEQILVCENPIKISTNKVNYIQASFDLGTNWSGFDSVRAVWFNDFNCISTVIDSLGNCVVPFEVMKRKGNVKVNLVGSISEDDVLTDRLTSYPVVAVIVDCTAQIVGSNTQPITPSEFEQFARRVHADADRAGAGATASEQSATESANSASASAESAQEAEAHASSAQIYAGMASNEAEASANSASEAQTYAQNASESATDAEGYAEDAESARDTILGMRATANTLSEGSDATASYSNGLLTLGIPRGNTGATGPTGPQGETGATPNLSIGNVETLEPNESATATISGTAEEPILSFGIPKGDTGEVSLEELEQATVVQTLSDNEPYHFRRTHNGQGSGHREYDEIVGASVGWNQLASDDVAEYKTYNTTILKSGNVITITSTTDASNQKYAKITSSTLNHVYCIGGSAKTDGTALSARIGLYDSVGTYVGGFSATSNTWASGFSVVKATTSGYIALRMSNGSAVGVSCDYEDVQVIDLTLFNSAIADYVYSLEQSTAGSGVAWLKTHFPKLFDAYQPFDSGSIKSVSGLEGHEMVGVNLWDEEWEVGSISTSDGQNTSSSTLIRSKNYISVIPNETYWAKAPASSGGNLFYYDADKNYLSYVGFAVNTYYTIPSNARYARFRMGSSYGATYKNDICINLSDASKNGTYEPYTKHTYPLGSSVTLRGKYYLDSNNQLYAVGDVYPSSGQIGRNYAEITFDGSENWRQISGQSVFYAIKDNMDYAWKSNVYAMTPKYVFYGTRSSGYSNMSDKEFLLYYPGGGAHINEIAFRDNSVADVAAWKAKLQNEPITVLYEVATPTTETATPYTSPQWCDSHGTEEYVGSELPVGHSTSYPMSLVDTMPTTNGTFEPRVTVTNGVRTVTWVSV